MTALLEQLRSRLADRYRLERELGAGGMAVVFLATDLKHERQVAVKALRPELSAAMGADRFLREIRVTAHLQHPHILPLYDSGAAGELLYYVMPFVAGETLRERLRRERQLPVDEALAITRAVAGALDYAHRQGVLHRDIKPENILLHDGQPLVADFGIALAISAATGDRLTSSGLVIGTPSYMSPEQVTAEPTIDARSDVYALACVAYEMLAGEPPYAGGSAQAVIAAIMSRDPAPLTERRRSVPEPVAMAIERGLERLPADRFGTAAEFAAALVAPDGRTAPRRRPAPTRKAPYLAMGAVAGLLVGAVAGYLAAPDERPLVRHWGIILPDSVPMALAGPTLAAGWQTAIAIAPDGEHLAYVAPRGNTTVLALRSLESDSVVTLVGTEGANYPFYSPDGAWIGFFAGNLLRKVPSSGGTPVTLTQVNRVTGATWVEPDRILLIQNEGFDLHWISSSGTADTTARLTTQFGNPQVLPGNEWAVGQLGSGQLALLSLRDASELAITRRGVIPLDSVRQSDLLFGTSPRWLPSGHLVYATGDGQLMALPFDARRPEVTGEPTPVADGVRMEDGFGSAEFAVSPKGALVYAPGRNQMYVSLGFVRPDGSIDTLPFPRAAYTQPRISPDGTRLALQVRNPIGGWQVLLIDLTTGVRQPIEVEGNYRAFPASWLPSGRELLIGTWDPVQFLNYGARIQSLETGRYTQLPLTGASYMTISPDGSQFVYSDWRTGDLYLRRLSGDTTSTRIPARGFAASFSPDGKWAAWGGVTGEVAVSPVPPTGAIHVVAERGQMPLWSPRGDALVYRSGTRYYRVPISTANGFRAGRAELLVDGAFLSTFAWNHAMSPDGRLLVLLNSPERAAGSLRVITGFPELARRRAPRR